MLRKLAVTTALAAAFVGISAGTASANAIFEATACPSGYTGVIVTVAGKPTSVCQNIIK